MHRRTLHVNQYATLEDHLLQERYALNALSALLGAQLGLISQSDMITAGVETQKTAIWLPGPYVQRTPGVDVIGFTSSVFPVDENETTVNSVEQGPIGFVTGTLGQITIPTPLALAQAVVPDPSTWSTLAADVDPKFVIGILDPSQDPNVFPTTFGLPMPPVGGGGEKQYQKTIITGRVVMLEVDGQISIYNAADPPNPNTATEERVRFALLQLRSYQGAVSQQFAGAIGKFVPPLPASGQQFPPDDPPSPVIPAGEVGLFDIVTSSDAGPPIESITLHYRSERKARALSRGHHHVPFTNQSPRIRPNIEVEPATFTRRLPHPTTALLYPVYPDQIPFNDDAALQVTDIPEIYSHRYSLVEISANVTLTTSGGFPFALILRVGSASTASVEVERQNVTIPRPDISTVSIDPAVLLPPPPAGTALVLTVSRDGFSQRKTFNIRRVISVEEIEAALQAAGQPFNPTVVNVLSYVGLHVAGISQPFTFPDPNTGTITPEQDTLFCGDITVKISAQA